MRVGQNPAKKAESVVKPERITVAVLNYIPFVSGFFAEMPQVLKVCLDSIREHTDLPFDLMVFDNGSCPEVVQYLVDERNRGKIQYLILSEKNLGKGGAWNIIFDASPGEIIAYTDNDCLFYDGWLSESMKILETYPKVGMVTACPLLTRPEKSPGTIAWAKGHPDVLYEEGRLIDFSILHEFNLSLGQTEEESLGYINTIPNIQIKYRNLLAFVGASHWQFVTLKTTIRKFLPFEMDRPMGQVSQLDQRMEDNGYLRLMTASRHVMNMSNTVSNQFSAVTKSMLKKKRVWNSRPIKSVMMKIYNIIFKIYYESP